jgi:penicillin-binding protein 1A
VAAAFPDNAAVQRTPAGTVALALSLTLTLSPLAPVRAATFDLPPIDRIVNYQPRQPLQVLTADGVEIAQFGTERRQYTPLAQIPRRFQDALLAVEDGRFRSHSGIDPQGMARAVLSMLTGGRKQGASTITQQLVRTMLLTQQFTAERKAKEILLALKVEQALSKDRILEIYLNEIFLGQRAYGFAAASQTYFGKPLDKLGWAETAMLVGLPQNPHYANPVVNLARATQRQRVVLQRLHETGLINASELAAARAEKLALRSPLDAPLQAGHVAEMARRVVVERFGTEAYTTGLRVVTSLRAADQKAAVAAVQKGILAHDRKGPWRGPEDIEPLPASDPATTEAAAALALKNHRDDELLRVGIVLQASPAAVTVQLATGEAVTLRGEALRWAQPALAAKARAPLAIKRGAIVRLVRQDPRQGPGWALSQWPQVQAGLVALDPATGRIRALVGGFDFTQQAFNHATQAFRQPGSSFKPFLYSAALERGVMPATLIDDLPFVSDNDGGKAWAPQNYDGKFDGPITLRDALVRSKNLVSVRLAQHVGVGAARDWAARFGIDPARQPDNLTMALGSGAASPLQMAQAYGVFANGGWRVPPVLVERITDANGKVLFEAPPPATLSEDTRAVPARNVFVANSLMADVTRMGTAASAQARLKRPDLYGKTGTTNDAVDAWFAGFQPRLVAVVWMGFSDAARSLGERESGSALALPIWIDYMAVALNGVPVQTLDVPPGVQRLDDEWIYDEWLGGGQVAHLRADAPPLIKPAAMAIPPAPAASTTP